MTAQELAEIRARFEERGIRYQGSSLDFKALLDEVVRLQAEREALMADLKELASEYQSCELCRHLDVVSRDCNNEQFRTCVDYSNWQWRGVQSKLPAS